MSVTRVALALWVAAFWVATAWAGGAPDLAPPSVTNQCISFTVGPGTGCAWMCAHCADALGPAYYFPDGVCAYQSGGCAGNPIAGVTYTCCAAQDQNQCASGVINSSFSKTKPKTKSNSKSKSKSKSKK